MKGLEPENGEDNDDRADLVPLIDCVFLVLLFYVVAATFSEDASLFKVELPQAKQASVRASEDTVTVSVSKDGQFAIGEKLVTDTQLLPELENLQKQRKIETLVIRGDRGCPYEKIVDALDVAHVLKITEFSLVVAQP